MKSLLKNYITIISVSISSEYELNDAETVHTYEKLHR